MANPISHMLLGTLIWILSAPLLLPILVIFGIYRLFIALWIWVAYPPGSLEQMNFNDIVLGSCPTGMMLCYGLHLRGIVSLPKFRTHFASTFLDNGKDSRFPIFFYDTTTIGGYSYKKRVVRIPNLQKHIRQVTLTPEEESNLDPTLLKIVGDNDAIRGPNLPKWELVLVILPLLGRSVLLLKLSHSLVDAYSYFYLLNKLGGVDGVAYKAKAVKRSGIYKIGMWCKAPWTIYKYMAELSLGGNSKLSFGSDLVAKREVTDFPTLNASVTLDFGKVKEISELTGTRILHVLLALHWWGVKKAAERVGGRELDQRTKVDPLLAVFSWPRPNHPAVTQGRCTNHTDVGTICLHLNRTDRLSHLAEIARLVENNLDSDSPTIVTNVFNAAAILLPKNLLMWHGSNEEFPYLYNVTPFIASETYEILGIKADAVKMRLNGDDIPYINGIGFGSVTQGDRIHVTIGSSHELFLSQEELTEHVCHLIPRELDLFLKESRAAVVT